MSMELATITQDLVEIKARLAEQKVSRLDDSLFSKELAPHYSQLAVKLASSNVIPKQYIGKPTDIFVAMAMGYQLGMPVEQAIQDIAVINGRPSLWGDGFLAVVMSHPHFEDIIEEPIITDGITTGYQCTIKRKNRTPTVRTYTLQDAKKAGLLGKQGPWTTATSRMLQMRARAFAARDSFPDALRGIKSAEEVLDYIDAEYQVVPEQKATRTEQLKHEMSIKSGGMDDKEAVINNTESDTNDLDIPLAQQTEDRSESVSMESPGESEIASGDACSELALSSDQLQEITNLIIEKQFTETRVNKALKFYEVTTITELNQQLADDFIVKLKKA